MTYVIVAFAAFALGLLTMGLLASASQRDERVASLDMRCLAARRARGPLNDPVAVWANLSHLRERQKRATLREPGIGCDDSVLRMSCVDTRFGSVGTAEDLSKAKRPTRRAERERGDKFRGQRRRKPAPEGTGFRILAWWAV